MPNIGMTCPFSKKMCTDCVLYRGRHRYISPSKLHGVVAMRPKRHARLGLHSLSDDFEFLEKSSEPWSGRYDETRGQPRIQLKVIDMESNSTRICSLEEAKKWDWTNLRTWRIIDGRQIRSLDNLIEILRHKAESGFEEAELYEAPRFMLLAGG